MLGTRYIFSGLVALGLVIGHEAQARPLTSFEMIVCPKLKNCVDILTAHDASEFDYSVLAAEFRRFGPNGRKALFAILNSDAGHPDIARLIGSLGALNAAEDDLLDKIWSGQRAVNVAPLFEVASLRNRDRWIAGLAHKNTNVREVSQRVYRMDRTLISAPITAAQQDIILNDIRSRPHWIKADLLNLISARGRESEFAQLISINTEPRLAFAAYEGLYRADPSAAFQTFMKLASEIETSQQARHLGNLIASRHPNRADGFYGKFAWDVSGDTTMPVQVRAVGLHAWFSVINSGALDFGGLTKAVKFDAPRLDALRFLLDTQSSDISVYSNVLKGLPQGISTPALSLILQNHLKTTHFTDVSLLKAAYSTPLEEKAMSAALQSNDLLVAAEAIIHAEGRSQYQNELQALMAHPVTELRVAAALALKGRLSKMSTSGLQQAVSKSNNKAPTCRINAFNHRDLKTQMPYFDDQPLKVKGSDPWLKAVSRKTLIAAHPTTEGWLASYYLAPKSETFYFDNRSGKGKIIGQFAEPFAILPDRPLPLGQTTQTFWVVDGVGHMGYRSFLYRISLQDDGYRQTRIAELPSPPSDVALTAIGEIVVAFETKDRAAVQPPLRYSPTGNISLACRAPSSPS